jgi:hypothetical protein
VLSRFDRCFVPELQYRMHTVAWILADTAVQ